MTRLDLIAGLQPKSGVEVGVLNGDFSAEMLTVTTLSHLLLVDAWTHFTDGPYRMDPANVDQGGQDSREVSVRDRFAGDGRVFVRKGFSFDVAAQLRGIKYDFVFLDAAHDYFGVREDLEAWRSLTSTMLIHDYIDSPAARSMGFNVVSAVDDFCRVTGWRKAVVTDEEWPTVMLIDR